MEQVKGMHYIMIEAVRRKSRIVIRAFSALPLWQEIPPLDHESPLISRVKCLRVLHRSHRDFRNREAELAAGWCVWLDSNSLAAPYPMSATHTNPPLIRLRSPPHISARSPVRQSNPR